MISSFYLGWPFTDGQHGHFRIFSAAKILFLVFTFNWLLIKNQSIHGPFLPLMNTTKGPNEIFQNKLLVLRLASRPTVK